MAERAARTARVALALLVALGALALVRPAWPPAAPSPVPAAQAEAWMVDALPGIGPKRLPAALEDVRAGRFEALPAPARATADAVFTR